MKVTGLSIYPVKSLGGRPVDSASVEPQGLTGDRRWCLVDGAGEVVTARECHDLLRLDAEIIDEETIRLTDRADGAEILVDTPLGLPAVPVSLSRMPCATPADDDVNEWISTQVGRPLRLVWQEDSSSRSISESHGGEPGDVVSMADTGPLLLVSESSLKQLNEWIVLNSPGAEALDMLRFRPNVVIDGAEPFAEDIWKSVQIGEVTFRTTELCDRCVMTTIDPVTLAKGKEPIRTLARHRRWEGATWFGTRLTPRGGGILRVGDAVVPGS